MTTLELEARKASLAREVLNLDSLELVKKAADYLHRLTQGYAPASEDYPATAREEAALSQGYAPASEDYPATAREEAAPYTREEIDAWIDRSEADIAAGRTYTNEEVEAEERKAFPWLTK